MTPIDPTAEMDNSHGISAVRMIDQQVADIEGRVVGKVKDIVFEPDSGMLAYVSIRLDDGQILIVPYQAVEFDKDLQIVRLKMFQESIVSQ